MGGASDTYPLYDSLASFLSGLISSSKDIIRKNILAILIPAIILAIITYFGIYQYIIYLMADLADGITKYDYCTPTAGNMCNIAGFDSNPFAIPNAFSLLFFTSAFIFSVAGTIRSLGVSRYLSQASGIVSYISQAISHNKAGIVPVLLSGAGAGMVIGILFSSTTILSISVIGLFIHTLIMGNNGLLTPIIQYAHRDIVRRRSGQNVPRLIEPGLVSAGITAGGAGYALSSFLLAGNQVISGLLGIILIGAGGYLLYGDQKFLKLAPVLLIILVTGLLVTVLVPPADAHDGGTSECGGKENWDKCPGAEKVKDEATKDAAAAAAGVAAGVVVGNVGSVAARAAAMARARKDALKGKEDTEEGPIGYILQLSKDSLTIGVGKNDSFTATAWKVEKDGSYSQEPSASLQITAPDIAGLSLSDTSGTGSLAVTVSVTEPPDATSATLTVHASAGGKSFSAEVGITFEASLQVGFE